MNMLCFCGNNKNYQNCCGLYIQGNAIPDTPEQLMRSRYTAYAIHNIDYIVNTMCGKAIKGFDRQDAEHSAKSIIWQKLEIINTNMINDNKGFVEFKAYFIENQQQYILHENSEFHRINGKWFYVNGKIF